MSSLAQVVEQWTGNSKAAGSKPAEDNFFALVILTGRRSVGFRLVTCGPCSSIPRTD